MSWRIPTSPTALAAQRASDAQVRAVMDYVGEGIVTFGEDGVIRTANPAAERAFAVAGGLPGRMLDDILVELPWTEVRNVLPEILGRRRLVTARRGDGSEFPLELVVSGARVHGERLLIGIGQDVTERLRGQAALRESEQRFRAVFDHAPIAMVVVDSDRERTILDANAAMGELLGLPARELPGQPSTELIDPGADVDAITELMAGRRDVYRREQRAPAPGRDERVGRRQRCRSCATPMASPSTRSACSKTSRSASRTSGSRMSSSPSSATSCAPR